MTKVSAFMRSQPTLSYIRHLAIFLLWILLPLCASAQKPLVKYTEFRAGREMAHTRVSSFYQDSEGFIWMGSWIGLCRFDGQQFTFFRAEPGNNNPQDNNRVLKIGETPEGRLWCQTYDRRLFYFDRQNCTFEPMSPDDLPASATQHHQQWRHEWSMRDAFGTQWKIIDDQHLGWVDSLTGQLRPIEEALDRRYLGHLPISRFHIFFVDHQRNLWVSAGTELFRLTFQQRQTERIDLAPLQEIRSMTHDEGDQILVGDRAGHLCYYSLADGSRRYLRPDGTTSPRPTQFSSKGIYCTMRDSRGRLWIGTRGDGLYCISEGRVHHYRRTPGDSLSLSSNHVYDLLEDRTGNLWIATYEGGGLNKVPAADLTAPHPTHLRFVHKGNAWHDYPALGNNTRCLAEDKQGRILAGTNEGVLIRDEQAASWQLCRHDSGSAHSLPGNTVMSVLTRDSLTYVLSYGYGISRMTDTPDGFRFETAINKDFPAGDIAVTAQIDNDGHVWYVGETSFTRYAPGRDTGINANTASLAPARNAEGSTNCSSTGSQPTLSYYDSHDFDDDYTFTETRPLVLPSGLMLLGMDGAIMTFDTRTLRKSDFQPRIVFSRYSFPGSDDETEHYICDLSSLTLSPDRRSVSIQFSALDFQPSHLMRYAYRLIEDGHSEKPEWTTTTQPVVNFLDLPAGRYRLEVRSTNADGVWCTNQRTLLLDVTPTFWETGWAYLVWALLFLALATLIGYTVAYIFRLNRRKLQLETVLERYMSQHAPLHPLSHASGSTATPHSHSDLETGNLSLPHRQDNLGTSNPSTPHGHSDLGTSVPSIPQSGTLTGESGVSALQQTPNINPSAASATQQTGQNGGKDATTLQNTTSNAEGHTSAPQQTPQNGESTLTASHNKGSETHPNAEAIINQLQEPVYKSYDEQFMEELMLYLDQHLSDQDLSVASFAEAMHMSQATFYRKLKSFVGLSPVDFFRKVRMRRAVQYLEAGEESISQVAYYVGFSDPKYFSKCFKHDMGVSPVEYRQQVAERNRNKK